MSSLARDLKKIVKSSNVRTERSALRRNKPSFGIKTYIRPKRAKFDNKGPTNSRKSNEVTPDEAGQSKTTSATNVLQENLDEYDYQLNSPHNHDESQKLLNENLKQVLKKLKSVTKNETLATSPEKENEDIENVKEWEERQKKIEHEFQQSRDHHFKRIIESEAYLIPCRCAFCPTPASMLTVRCSTCRFNLCPACDMEFHRKFVFHNRVFVSPGEIIKKHLAQDQFIAPTGDIVEQAVMVPCLQPVICPSCNECHTLNVEPGSRMITVVTSDGRFELRMPAFRCSNVKCNHVFDARMEDFIVSGFWPGTVTHISYLFSEELLLMWYHTQHKTPGTSQRKFLQIFEEMSMEHDRCGIINPTLFQFASSEYEYLCYSVTSRIKRCSFLICKACGERPLVVHCDGNCKAYRLMSAKDRGSKSLFGGDVIATDEEVSRHIEKVNGVIPPLQGHGTCGSSTFKAARTDSSYYKSLDESGFLCQCCRHGVILHAANMYQGETFRLINYMHYHANVRKCLFFCYDIICRYWDFARKVGLSKLGEIDPQFKAMTDKMFPFLSRFHGKAHSWDCQVIWSGHWRKGAAATLGEEQEQGFRHISLYGCTTKHMSKSNRRDHLSKAIIYFNRVKEQNMVKTLCKRLATARKKVPQFEAILKKMMNTRNVCLNDLPAIAKRLRDQALLCKDKRLSQGKKWPLSTLQRELEGVVLIMKILKDRVSKKAARGKPRAIFRKRMGKAKTRVDKLIELINEKSEIKVNHQHCLSGFYPWLKNGTASVEDDFQLVSAWMIMDRFKEEIPQTQSEMITFIEQLCESRQALENDINGLMSLIPQTPLSRGTAVLKRTEIARIDEMGREAALSFDIDIPLSPSDNCNKEKNVLVESAEIGEESNPVNVIEDDCGEWEEYDSSDDEDDDDEDLDDDLTNVCLDSDCSEEDYQ